MPGGFKTTKNTSPGLQAPTEMHRKGKAEGRVGPDSGGTPLAFDGAHGDALGEILLEGH